jgi:hypothetical protein
MVGDFIFALSTFPIKLGLELWDKRFGFDPSYYYNPGILDTETETETTTDMSSEPPEPHTQRASPNRKPDEVKFPRKGARKPTSDNANIHQPIASSSRTRHPLPKQDVEPNFYTTSSTSASASSTPPQQQRQKLKGRQHEVWYPPPSAYAGDDEHLQDSRTITTTASLIGLDVQVTTEKQKLEDAEEWRQYPAFPSAYPPTPLVTSSRLVSTRGAIRTTTNMYPIIREEDLKDAEEWRRYPAFPAAYPPTPLVVSGARLHGIGSPRPFVVEEDGEEGEGEGGDGDDEEGEERDGNDGPEQDFRGSLQPLRKPLNPGFTSDSSDSYRSSYGIQNQNDFLASSFSAVISPADTSSSSDSDMDYSDVDDEEEEEDNFNITLQTPLHYPLGVVVPISIPIPRNQRPVSMTSTLASVSTALTTVHDGSLRTSSSGSGSGGGDGEDDEMEEEGEKENAATSFTTLPSSSSVLGKKRALQGQGDRGDVMRKARGTESPHGRGKSGKKRRVSTSQSPTRQQRAGLAALTTDEEGNVQFSSASEARDAEQSQRARTPTPTNTKAKSGRRRRTPLSPSRVNAPRSPLRMNTAPSPSRGNGTRSPLRGNAKRSPSRGNARQSPSRLNARRSPLRGNATRSPGTLSPLRGNITLSPSQVNTTTTRAVRPRVTRYATPPPLPMALGSMEIGAITTGIEMTTTAPGSTTTTPESTTLGAGTTTENRTLVAPQRPDPILIPDKQTRRGFRPQVPIAQRSSRRLRSEASMAQVTPLAPGDPDSGPPEQGRRRTAVNVRTATNARTTRK